MKAHDRKRKTKEVTGKEQNRRTGPEVGTKIIYLTGASNERE